MQDNMRLVSYPPQGKEKEAGDAAKTVIYCVLIVCLTLLAFIRITHGYLCEIHIKTVIKKWRLFWPTHPNGKLTQRRGGYSPLVGPRGINLVALVSATKHPFISCRINRRSEP